MFKNFGIVVMSETEFNAALNQSMLKGHRIGYEEGKFEGIGAKVTPNVMLELLGLKKDHDNYDGKD